MSLDTGFAEIRQEAKADGSEEEKGYIQVCPDLPDKFWVRFLSPHALYKENACRTEIVTRKNSGQRIFTKWAAKRSGHRGPAATRRGGPTMLGSSGDTIPNSEKLGMVSPELSQLAWLFSLSRKDWEQRDRRASS